MKDQIIKGFGLENANIEEFGKYLIVRTENASGYPVAQIFKTTVQKLWKAKVQGFYFKTVESREDHIEAFKKRVGEIEAWKEERKQARKNFVNPAKVGDILYSSWGYDQTNIDFFEVIAVNGKQVTVRELTQSREQTEWLQGNCLPNPGSFLKDSQPVKRLVKPGYSGEYAITVDSVRSAWPWDGKAKGYTQYA